MRTIVHLDADAFFAAVEQASDAHLRGKPIAVGGEKRGIIASASYEARKFGVYTPMPTMRARKLCPKLIVLPGDYERYEQFSSWMFSYCYDFTPDVEQTSIDEGYFDLSGARKSPVEIALTIRKAIGQKLKITVSEGIASNKLVSAVASKLRKPNAFDEVPPGSEMSFLQPLPNKWLPGIGPKTSTRLNAAGLAEIRHVAATPLEMLELLLGQQAAVIRQYSHGIDERPLIPVRESQKTFSHQETFGKDLTDEEYVEAILRRMADDLFAKVREEKRTIRTLHVRVRYHDMGEDQVSESLAEPSDLETDIYGRLHGMLRKAWKRRVSLRLVSLKLSNIYDGRFRSELPLDVPAQRQDARVRLAAVIDELRHARGRSVILRGHDFRLLQPLAETLAATPVAPIIRRRVIPAKQVAPYVPLRVRSHYSFLDSMLSPTAIVELAKRHGMSVVALTDTGNLHGAVEFTEAARKAGIKPILGVELRVGDNPFLLYVESAQGYHNLCRLLSRHAERSDRNSDEASVVGQQRRPYRLSKVCRNGTHLFHFAEYVNAMRGWGRGLRNAVGDWYVGRGADDLAHQAVKYQQRDGWSHCDLLRLAHPKALSAQHESVFRWLLAGANSLGEREVKRKIRGEDRVAKYGAVGALPKIIDAFEQAKRASSSGEIVKLINEFDLPREAIPTQWLNEAVVWEALLERMPMTAMIRNLGKMTSLGLLAPFSDAKRLIVRKLRDETALKRARIHPLAVLVAQKIYAQGHGDKGALKWSPVSAVVDALDEAFYATFQNVEPCNKPVLLALDVSGSMAAPMIAGSCISPREGSAAMALITASTEPECEIIAFSAPAKGRFGGMHGGGEPGITRVNLSPRMRLTDVIKRIEAIPMGGTDCALPMVWAARNKLNVSAFITYTDSETWAGNIHPAQALRQYRDEFVGNAKAVVVGMTSNGFTLADPNDRGMLDVVGFDTTVPAIIADFVRE